MMRQLRAAPTLVGSSSSSSRNAVASAAKRAASVAKPTVVVIGTGWAGARFVRDIDPNKYNLAVLSQRNHMVFTPLLPQTCTGTLEFRSICEPIQRIQPALAAPNNAFYRTMVYDVDFEAKAVQCVTVGVLGATREVPVQSFDFKYDKLVLAHGARPATFNIPGVEEHAFYLREISEARGIRRRLVQNIMTAKLPTTDEVEMKRLLHVVVVGGGPTGVEFAADLADFLRQDIPKIDPSLLKYFRVTLVEANEVLGTFDLRLRNYGANRLQRMGVHLKKAIVAEVTEDSITLTDGEEIRTGLIVWSTGVGPSTLTQQLNCDKNKQGRIAIDDHLRVLRNGAPVPDVYAIGDCAANATTPLPTLAAVASRQGLHLAEKFNLQAGNGAKDNGPFVYKHLGSMASIGSGAALIELKEPSRFDMKGLHALLIWRSAYFTMLGSVRSRLYVLVNWFGSLIFGRDITYISEISEAKLWKNLAQQGASKEQARRKLIADAKKDPKVVVTLGSQHPVEPLAKGRTAVSPPTPDKV